MEVVRERTMAATSRPMLGNVGISQPRAGNSGRPKMQISRTGSIFETATLKVAAYARVSTALEEQEESYESQKAYYEALIKSNSKWKYAGIYADKGLSGTDATHRPQFQKLIADAKAGKINIILVKSISRFGRNAVDVQKYLHELKTYNVEVRFDKEQLSSFDGKTEMILNTMAMVAEQESRSISKNTKWALQKQAERGIRYLGDNHVFGYDEVDGKLVPNKDDWAVKLMFEEYAKGKSINKIVDILQKLGVKTIRGNDRFYPDTIRAMLKNEIYKGDRLIQKQAPRDMLTKKPDATADYESYYVEDDHETIVSPELWEQVQNRSTKGNRAVVIEQVNSHFLLGRIFCKECGNPYIRQTFSRKNGRLAGWECRDRVAGKKGHGCKNAIIMEADLFAKIESAIGTPVTEESCGHIEQIVVDKKELDIKI